MAGSKKWQESCNGSPCPSVVSTDCLVVGNCALGEFRKQTVDSYLNSSGRSINDVCRSWSRWKLALFLNLPFSIYPWSISLFYSTLGFCNHSLLIPSSICNYRRFSVSFLLWYWSSLLIYSKHSDPDARLENLRVSKWVIIHTEWRGTNQNELQKREVV